MKRPVLEEMSVESVCYPVPCIACWAEPDSRQFRGWLHRPPLGDMDAGEGSLNLPEMLHLTRVPAMVAAG